MAASFKLIDVTANPPTSIDFGWGESPVGVALMAWDDIGVRYLSLAPNQSGDGLLDLRSQWPTATLVDRSDKARRLIGNVFDQGCALPVALQGSSFQRRVWRELVAIPRGQVAAYSELAAQVGSPRAARAVGSALAANRIAFLIPCHRILKKNGDIGQFRWGASLKEGLLQWERQNPTSAPDLPHERPN